jgi:hypothetical protein
LDEARGSRHQGSAGASAVEFAILFPLLAMLLFGMLSGGLALNQQQQLNHAAREGARFGATLDGFPGVAAADTVVARARNTARFLTDADDAVYCVLFPTGSPARYWYVGPTGSGSSAPPAGFSAADDCPDLLAGDASADERVQVSIRVPARIEAVLMRRTVRLAADAVAIYEMGD